MASPPTSNWQYVPPRKQPSDFPLIDGDPHLFRVCRYMRTSDYVTAAGVAAATPAAMLAMEKWSPSYAGKGAFPPVLRLAVGLGLGAGFIVAYSRSSQRFLGLLENSREVDMDMREMVDKVKKGEPLYGVSQLPEHQQHMAARNSRYASVFIGVLPWFNLVNHNHHGVDTAKYYQQAERELDSEREG
ncbi:NADH-ubiquinone oxidoreductase 21 kDa subunit [Microthyrium microscopicum]|uniref:NADH-ubiquinone oxidoreductase 21 kDa subunit n=1 Tax=Microthyrium microscopicum TaxID=703497 RepID=A0A6A6UK73_9PEZI|nr:NADH-ubiquinone oxidoreductase 21 kDa subunit [Microthyrium microscopicum]